MIIHVIIFQISDDYWIRRNILMYTCPHQQLGLGPFSRKSLVVASRIRVFWNSFDIHKLKKVLLGQQTYKK